MVIKKVNIYNEVYVEDESAETANGIRLCVVAYN